MKGFGREMDNTKGVHLEFLSRDIQLFFEPCCSVGIDAGSQRIVLIPNPLISWCQVALIRGSQDLSGTSPDVDRSEGRSGESERRSLPGTSGLHDNGTISLVLL